MERGSALDLIARDVKRAIEDGLYYAGLTTALTIPHICAALERPDGRAKGVHYKVWCSRFVCAGLRNIAPEILYDLRCAVLHEGRMRVKPIPSKTGVVPPIHRLVFVLPGTYEFVHGDQVNDALQFSLPLFCAIMTDGLKQWWAEEGTSLAVQRNMPSLLQWRIVTRQSGLVHSSKKIAVIA